MGLLRDSGEAAAVAVAAAAAAAAAVGRVAAKVLLFLSLTQWNKFGPDGMPGVVL